MRRASFLMLAATALLLLAFAQSASAASPGWKVRSIAVPTNFPPGDTTAHPFYEVLAENQGAAATDGSEITLTDHLPAGLQVEGVGLIVRSSFTDIAGEACTTDESGAAAVVTCSLSESLVEESEAAKIWPSETIRLVVHVVVPAQASGDLENEAAVEGGGAESPATVTNFNQASSTPAGAGLSEFSAYATDEDGSVLTQAGAHPYEYTTAFAVNTVAAPAGAFAPFVPAGGDVKDIEVMLPPGFSGNPNAATRCTAEQFNTQHVAGSGGHNIIGNLCPSSSVVGLVVTDQVEGLGVVAPVPLYNLVPPEGMPAQFGFQIVGTPTYIDTKLRTGSDYGVTAYLRNVSEAKRVTAASVTIWGTPAVADHDRLRGLCLGGVNSFSFGECPAEVEDSLPFLRLSTSCGTPSVTEMLFSSWPQPTSFTGLASSSPAMTGCEALDFSPTVSAQPTTNVADSPSGLDFHLHLPQSQDPAQLGEADLRDAAVSLPEGLVINPASASGLGACTEAQVGIGSDSFPNCSDNSKLGAVEVSTPVVDHPLPGAIYLAEQSHNPFHSLFAAYIVVADPVSGIVVKLPVKVSPDASTGRLSTLVVDSPQQPIEDLDLKLFSGPRAALRTPDTCGASTIDTSLLPWSAGPGAAPSTSSDAFSIDAGPGGPCPTKKLEAKLNGGLADPQAGSHSTFALQLSRPDGTEELEGLSVATPKGLLARLARIPYCSEADIAKAMGRSQAGAGAELASPSCPTASQVGTTTVAAGAGSQPFYTSGRLFLAGPYKGAPLSLVATVPAVAGPFDLGAVVDRIALRVDPETAQVTADADPLPTILSGVPLDLREIRIALDRPNFMVAPTNCDEQSIAATIDGVGGESATASDRFQLTGCRKLKFSPKLGLALKGKMSRGSFPAFQATMRAKPGQANLERLSVALPHSAFLAQSHIGTICTRVQFAANACPKRSIYGKARAFSPLLDRPLEGPVYLRSSSHPLPDLVLALHGQIDIDVAGRIDSVHGGMRVTFGTIPDAPVSKVSVQMLGGKKGLLELSRDVCRSTGRATVKIGAQNGREEIARPILHTPCAVKRHRRATQRIEAH